MENIDAVILYKHVARELDIACAIKVFAEKIYGLKIEIVNWPYGVAEALKKLRPKIVFLPFCYNEKGQHYLNVFLFWESALFINLAWEQINYIGNMKSKTPEGFIAANHILHLAWSQDFADFLEEQGIPKKNIIINGNPSFVLYEDTYTSYFQRKDELAKNYKLDLNKTWIVFPDSFNWAFYSKTKISKLQEYHENKETIHTMQSFSKLSLEIIIQWLFNVAKKNDVEIIFRPRPDTPLEDFIAFTKRVIPISLGSIKILKKGSIREWILASDIVVSSHSTCLIEGAIAGKQVFMLEPIPLIESMHMEWQNHITRIRVKDEINNILLNNNDIDKGERLKKWATDKFLSSGDPIMNIVELINAIGHDNGYVDLSELVKIHGKNIIKVLMMFFPNAYMKWQFLFGHVHKHELENDQISKIEVIEKINLWSKIYDRKTSDEK